MSLQCLKQRLLDSTTCEEKNREHSLHLIKSSPSPAPWTVPHPASTSTWAALGSSVFQRIVILSMDRSFFIFYIYVALSLCYSLHYTSFKLFLTVILLGWYYYYLLHKREMKVQRSQATFPGLIKQQRDFNLTLTWSPCSEQLWNTAPILLESSSLC